MPDRLLLVTDSAEPSGVGAHMVALAAALAERGLRPETLWPDHPAGRALAAQVTAAGGMAAVTDTGAMARAVADWARAATSRWSRTWPRR